MEQLIYTTLFKNWKTTVTAIVSAIVFLLAKFGFQVPSDVQLGIIAIVVFIQGLLSKDADQTGV